MTNYDVIIVGAGSSGLMAAVSAGQNGAKVLVLEKNKVPGRKLLLSGGGRCNVTNRTNRENLIQHIPGNGKFLYSALNQFDQEDIVAFFESKGVALKEEDHGRMFPVTDKARTILDTLLESLDELQVTIQYKSPVQALLHDDGKIIGVKTEAGEHINAPSVVLAVGGRAYPKTGATGDGYAWAKSVGHTIERLYPTESPLLSNDSEIVDGSLKGVSLRDVAVTVWEEDVGSKAIVVHHMDMLITHFGYSGPAILRCSGHVNQYLYQHQKDICHLSIDLTPRLTHEALREKAEDNRDKQVITILKQWMPERMAQALCDRLSIDSHRPYKQLLHQEITNLWNMVKTYTITAYGTQPIEKGFVTGGGVSTKEIEPKTMASKKIDGLYFCGEFMDINGYTGGYNITAAFVTGTIAGQYAAWNAFE